MFLAPIASDPTVCLNGDLAATMRDPLAMRKEHPLPLRASSFVQNSMMSTTMRGQMGPLPARPTTGYMRAVPDRSGHHEQHLEIPFFSQVFFETISEETRTDSLVAQPLDSLFTNKS